MNKEIRTVRCRDYEEVVEAAYFDYDEGEYDSFAFVGDLIAIKRILTVLLNDYDTELTSVHIDTVEYSDNMYQLTVDENELITIAPVLEYSNDDIRKGYVLIEGIGKWLVDDSVPTKFVRTLEKDEYNFEVFEVDGAEDDEEDVSHECEYCNGFCGGELAGYDEDSATFTIKVKPEIDNLTVEEFENLVHRLEVIFKKFNDFVDWF